jgi:hypothetical protein
LTFDLTDSLNSSIVYGPKSMILSSLQRSTCFATFARQIKNSSTASFHSGLAIRLESPISGAL